MSALFFLLCLSGTVLSIEHHLQERIVNGDPISSNDFPWMVSLRESDLSWDGSWYSNASYPFCGAALIQLSPPVIVTAAHCFDSYETQDDADGNEIIWYPDDAEPYQVTIYADINRTYPGDIVPGDSFGSLAITSLDMIFIHEQWDSEEPDPVKDIALIIFADHDQEAEPLPDIADMLPAIPEQLSLDTACCDIGDEFTAIGYGLNHSNGSATYSLERTTLLYIEELACFQDWPQDYGEEYEPDHTVICAEGDDTDTCQGDSGGPLISDADGDTTLVGVVSFGFGCNTNVPAGYTSVGHYRDWIDAKINEALGITTTPTMEGDDSTESAPTTTVLGDNEITNSSDTGDDDESEESAGTRSKSLFSFITLVTAITCTAFEL